MAAFQEIFVSVVGQDDNLGDSVLRAAQIDAIRAEGRRFHVHVGRQATSDYLSGFGLRDTDVVYGGWAPWAEASLSANRPIHLMNAGEIHPSGFFPAKDRVAPLERAAQVGGAVILAGLGLRRPEEGGQLQLAEAIRQAGIVSWRDRSTRDGVGFGEVNPDWAFRVGAATSDWVAPGSRPLLAVTLRFDRPWPGSTWLESVRRLAERTATRIVTVAQVARDAPRAVHLADALGGTFLMPPSTNHADLDAHVRSVYAQSLAVVSDRAHGLILGATEGAFPIGSAHDPEKIVRMMAEADLGAYVGTHAGVEALGFESHLPTLAAAVDTARGRVAQLAARINSAVASQVAAA